MKIQEFKRKLTVNSLLQLEDVNNIFDGAAEVMGSKTTDVSVVCPPDVCKRSFAISDVIFTIDGVKVSVVKNLNFPIGYGIEDLPICRVKGHLPAIVKAETIHNRQVLLVAPILELTAPVRNDIPVYGPTIDEVDAELATQSLVSLSDDLLEAIKVDLITKVMSVGNKFKVYKPIVNEYIDIIEAYTWDDLQLGMTAPAGDVAGLQGSVDIHWHNVMILPRVSAASANNNYNNQTIRNFVALSILPESYPAPKNATPARGIR